MKLREKDYFAYKGWHVEKMSGFDDTFWVASKHWNHKDIGTFRSVTISSFDQAFKVREYAKLMNGILSFDKDLNDGKH